MNKRSFFIVFIIIIITSARAPAQVPDTGLYPLQGQKRLVLQLWTKKMHFDCISETRRLAYFDPQAGRASDYRYFMALNYYLGGQYLSAAETLYKGGDLHTMELRELYLTAGSYMKLGDLQNAENILSNAPDYSALAREQAVELAGRRAHLYISRRDYPAASAETARALAAHRDERLTEISRALEARENIFFRSPALSASMSALLPGAGQLYSGYAGAALLSLLSVTLPAAASWYAEERGYRGIAAGSAFFSLLFYAGSIYGGYNSAHKKNLDLHREFYEKTSMGPIPPYDPASYIDTEALLR